MDPSPHQAGHGSDAHPHFEANVDDEPHDRPFSNGDDHANAYAYTQRHAYALRNDDPVAGAHFWNLAIHRRGRRYPV